jgi:RNA polymerase sigma-70 factor (ECF subfamily)
MAGTNTVAVDERRMWEAYRAELIRFVARRVRTREMAEDIVHDVLTRAHEKREQLESPGHLRSWLFRITRNAVIDHYRARKEIEPLPEDLTDEAAAEGRSPERELARCLTPLVDALPSPYRRVVELTEIEGRTQKEVAGELGLSVSGAKSRIQRARRMLEDALRACCRIEIDARGRVLDYESEGACEGCSAAPEARSLAPRHKSTNSAESEGHSRSS